MIFSILHPLSRAALIEPKGMCGTGKFKIKGVNIMKKNFCLIMAGALTITLLVGCTGNKTAKTGGKTDLLIGLPGGDAVTDMRVVDAFKEARKEQYNIKTDESSWSDFTKKVKLQLVAKNDITPIFFTDSAQAMAFGEQGALVDLDAKVKADIEEEKYIKALRAVTNLEGKLWGVPHALNAIAVLYNKDLFDERGVAYPTEDWTFADMLSMAEKLTFDRDGDGKTDVFGIYYLNNITQGWYPFMLAHGVSPLSEDFRNSNLDDPKIIEAMRDYQKPWVSGHVASGPEISAMGSIEAAIADGKIAMYLSQISTITSINKFNPDLNYDAQIMPIGWNGERSCIYVPNVWVIADSATDAQKEASWDFICHYLSEESQLMIAETTPSGVPIMKTALETVTNNGVKPEGKDAFYRGIDEFGTTILENPCSTDINAVINNMAMKVGLGESVEDCVATAHKELQETLDYFYSQAE